MCKAAKVTIAEVEEIVENGSIPPEDVHVPSIYVQRVVLGTKFEKRIEVRIHSKAFIIDLTYVNLSFLQKLTVKKGTSAGKSAAATSPAHLMRERIVRRAALEFKDGMFGV